MFVCSTAPVLPACWKFLAALFMRITLAATFFSLPGDGLGSNCFVGPGVGKVVIWLLFLTCPIGGCDVAWYFAALTLRKPLVWVWFMLRAVPSAYCTFFFSAVLCLKKDVPVLFYLRAGRGLVT